jgi:hypothetical protein
MHHHAPTMASAATLCRHGQERAYGAAAMSFGGVVALIGLRMAL